MQNQETTAIGDVTNNEERLLQDRIIRILSYTREPDVTFLYINDEFPEEPPSCSLFDDDVDSEIVLEKNGNSTTKGCHNMFPKLVTSKIFDFQSDKSYRIEDVVTRVYLPSEEFARVVELSPIKRFWSRMWNWCKTKASCK